MIFGTVPRTSCLQTLQACLSQMCGCLVTLPTYGPVPRKAKTGNTWYVLYLMTCLVDNHCQRIQSFCNNTFASEKLVIVRNVLILSSGLARSKFWSEQTLLLVDNHAPYLFSFYISGCDSLSQQIWERERSTLIVTTANAAMSPLQYPSLMLQLFSALIWK